MKIEAANTPVDETVTIKVAPTQRFERKFFVLPGNIGFAYTFLRQVCRPDREYPKDRVFSLYFDNDDLDQYMRSASGDFRKDKVRIRWYNDIANQDARVPVFLELKSRQGFASSKQRQSLMIPSQNLQPANLGKGIIDKTLLVETLAGFGHFPESPLKPIVVISYQRHRFNEMQTGVRVSFDYDISASVIAPQLGHRKREIRLAGGIIEVKGPTLELPITLRRMRLLDTDWSRFSKYGYCIDAYLSEPDGMALFWPSGRRA
jgi:hypothetical protein